MVVLTGAPGAGKTEVGRRLAGRYRATAAFLDLDQLGAVHPFRPGEAVYRLMAANLAACLPAYRAYGVRVVVLAGVLAPGRLLDHLAALRAEPGLRWQFYGLRAPRAELARRIG